MVPARGLGPAKKLLAGLFFKKTGKITMKNIINLTQFTILWGIITVMIIIITTIVNQLIKL